ncbi:MAG: ABC transporter permease [Propionibacteriaceae bacterium]|nr:ABC transporter permease [Propionibacteriaceae bacterium]
MLKQRKRRPRTRYLRQRMIAAIVISCLVILSVVVLNYALPEEAMELDLLAQKQPPSGKALFGTDWMGRDMFTRSMKGMFASLQIGLIACIISVVISVTLGSLAAIFGGKVDAAVSWIIDLFLGMPHLVLMILVSVALGGGPNGVIIAVAVTHWPTLARIVRAEVFQLKTADFILVARNMGKKPLWITSRHVIPHLVPQVVVGFVLLFPHAILHEASLTFLGFGLSPLKPALGVILAEALQHLSTGAWWLVLLPGLVLLAVVRCFDSIGSALNEFLDPHTLRSKR